MQTSLDSKKKRREKQFRFLSAFFSHEHPVQVSPACVTRSLRGIMLQSLLSVLLSTAFLQMTSLGFITSLQDETC